MFNKHTQNITLVISLLIKWFMAIEGKSHFEKDSDIPITEMRCDFF